MPHSDQNSILQKSYILSTGSSANAGEMAQYNAMIAQDGDLTSINALVDSYIDQLIAQQGLVATIQAIAKNGFGISLTATEAQANIDAFAAAGIGIGSELINHLSTMEITETYMSALDNRAIAATSFLESLNAADKSASFIGPGITSAVQILLQNIGSSSASLAKGMSGFNALSANLTPTGVTVTVGNYLSGATAFADVNGDGQLNAGEWSTTTSANGTFEVPNNIVAGKMSVYGGTDLLTSNAYQGVLGTSSVTTVVNPLTTVVAAIANLGLADDTLAATTMVKTVLDLPSDINLLSYNPLAVLSSITATASEKATALSVQATSQQISNIITQIASVIDNSATGATLQSGAAAVTNAIAEAISTAAGDPDGTIDLSGSTLGTIIQNAIDATGAAITVEQVALIAQVTSGSNAAAGAATTLTMLAQATDVAQGSATNALIAGVASGSFDNAVAGFTGSSLDAANYAATVGSSAPGVVLPPTASQNAAGADVTAPSATIVVSDTALKVGDTSLVTITFNKAVTGFSNADLTLANGTLTDVASTDSGVTWTATFTPSTDLTDTSNVITLANTGVTDAAGNAGVGTTDSNNYAIDTAAPTLAITSDVSAVKAGETATITFTFSEAPTGFAAGDVTTTGGALSGLAVTGNALVYTATFTPTAGQGSGNASITIAGNDYTDAAGNNNAGAGTTPAISIDTLRPTATIVFADTALKAGVTSLVTITFNEAVTGFSNADLTLANGTLTDVASTDSGVTWTATFTPSTDLTDTSNVITLANTGVTDAAGNAGVGTTDSNNYAIDTLRPSAPTAVTLSPVGGTVVPNSLNSTNTSLTAVATIAAGQATGGKAELKIGSTTIATDSSIGASDTSVTFDLATANNTDLKAAVAAGGVVSVNLVDKAGNSAASTLSNPTLVVDYDGGSLDLTATVDEEIDGTAENDTFSGTYGDAGSGYTFHTGDVLNGLAGTDTLNITTGAEASTPPDNLWLNKTNFEKVVFNSIGNGAQVITTGAAFEALFATNGVELSVETLLGAITVDLTTFTGAASIKTTTIGGGAHEITTGTGASTVNATGISAGAQTINGVGLTSAIASINGAGDQTIGTTTSGDLVSVIANILAAGDQTIESKSNSNVTIIANAAAGAQTITTAGGDDSVTSTGAAGETATTSTGAGNDVIISGLGDDVITGGLGTDTMTGGGGVDTFELNLDGSVIGLAMDKILDFNTGGADVLSFAGNNTVLYGVDLGAPVAGSNVSLTAGGMIGFHVSDSNLALKIIALQADMELDAAGSIAMFVHSDNTYVYYAGTAPGDVDDQLIELTGINTLTTIGAGGTTSIA